MDIYNIGHLRKNKHIWGTTSFAKQSVGPLKHGTLFEVSLVVVQPLYVHVLLRINPPLFSQTTNSSIQWSFHFQKCHPLEVLQLFIFPRLYVVTFLHSFVSPYVSMHIVLSIHTPPFTPVSIL